MGVWPALPGHGGVGCGLLYQDREVRMDGVWPALLGQGGKDGWVCGLL